MTTCPHCGNQTGVDGCWPWNPPDSTQLREDWSDCWELKVMSTSKSLDCEVYVTKGEEVNPAADGVLETVRELEEA